MEMNQTKDICKYTITEIFYYEIVQTDRYHMIKIFIITFCALAIILNGAMLFQIVLQKELRKRQHIFTGSLAFSDGMFTVFLLIAIAGKSDVSPTSRAAITAIGVSFSIVSLLTLVAIAFERLFVIVVFPYNPNVNSPKRLFVVVSVIYVLAFAYSVTFYYLNGTLFLVIGLTITNLLILIFLYCIYSFIFYSVTKHYKKMQSSRSRGRNASKRLLKTFSIIIISYTLCWLPINITVVIDTFLEYSCTKESFVNGYAVSFVFVTVYAVVNPLVYGWRFIEIRKNVLKNVCRMTTAVNSQSA